MPFLPSSMLLDNRLLAAERFITGILRTEKVRVLKSIKLGPRFFVAECVRAKTQLLFKSCLFTRADDNLTNEKFSREVLFLRHVQSSAKRSLLARATPRIAASGTHPRAWYLREYARGTLQNVRGGNVKFTPSFFTAETLRFILKLFSELQGLRRSDLPLSFRNLLHKPDRISDLLKFIQPHRRLITKALRDPGAWKRINAFLRENQDAYNSAPRVLVHQEPYAVHFIKQGPRWILIDWENIGWGNPAHDLVVLWMRSAGHARWQDSLYRAARAKTQYGDYERLWKVEVVLQSCFNITSWYSYPDRRDMRTLFTFSQKLLHSFFSLP